MLRIEHVLDPFHEFKIRPRGGPQIQLGFPIFRSKLYYSVVSMLNRFGRSFGFVEVRITDARSGARYHWRVQRPITSRSCDSVQEIRTTAAFSWVARYQGVNSGSGDGVSETRKLPSSRNSLSYRSITAALPPA